MLPDYITKFWGKAHPEDEAAGTAWHPLAYHCLDVAAVTGEYLRRNTKTTKTLAELLEASPVSVVPLMTFLAAAHDLGKFGLDFQSKAENVYSLLRPGKPLVGGTQHHSTSGLAVLLEWCAATFAPDEDLSLLAEFWEPLLNSACGHHGLPVSLVTSRLEGRQAKKEAQAWLGDVWHLLEAPSLTSVTSDASKIDVASQYMAGVLAVCDWVGSSQSYFPYEPPAYSLEGYWAKAKEKAKQAIEDTKLYEKRPATAMSFEKLYPGFTPTPLQRYANSVEVSGTPQLFILEDETGAGKTEAALTLAGRLISEGASTGALVCLPTQTTADAFCSRMVKVAGKFFDEEATFTLAHGNAKTSLSRLKGASPEGIEVELSSWASDSSKTALLSDLGVCTIDQVVLSVLASKHFAMRQLGLGQKVLVVDEAHACEPYLLKLLELTLESHARRGGSAIVLSATLPMASKKALVKAYLKGAERSASSSLVAQDYPLASAVTIKGPLAEVTETPIAQKNKGRTVPLAPVTDETASAAVDSWLSEGKCVLMLRNTVTRAQQAFDLYNRKYPGNVFLAHARFMTGHRAENDKFLLSAFGPASTKATREGMLVIATQVAEQSLDVDFDELITDISPVDSLLQRVGRWRRHLRTKDGVKSDVIQKDERQSTTVLVICPPALDPASFKVELPPGTAFVYEDLSVLWRTARLVHSRSIAIPSDVRAAVEFAYAGEELPAELEDADLKAEGKRIDSTKAATRRGVSSYSQRILDCILTEQMVTRLGEPSFTVTLCDEHSVPLMLPFELSNIKIRASLLQLDLDKKGNAKLCLQQTDVGTWYAMARSPTGGNKAVSYSIKRGLAISSAKK